MSKPLTLKLLKFYWGEKKSALLLPNSKPRVENEHFSIVKIPSIEHQLYKNPSCTSYRFFTAFWLLWAADTAALAWIKQLWIFVAWRGKNGSSNLINKSEKVFCVLYLELAKIPLRYVQKSVQLMMIFFESSNREREQKKSPSSFSWLTSLYKSYSLTFVNLLLQKLAGSKFSSLTYVCIKLKEAYE